MKVEIGIKNFGPIEKAQIELRPLTIFTGENNSGKTYMATAIYAIQNAFHRFNRQKAANTSKDFRRILGDSLEFYFNTSNIANLKKNGQDRQPTISIKIAEKDKAWNAKGTIQHPWPVFKEEPDMNHPLLEKWPTTQKQYYLPATRANVIQNYMLLTTNSLMSQEERGRQLSGTTAEFIHHLTTQWHTGIPEENPAQFFESKIHKIAEIIEADILGGKVSGDIRTPSGLYYSPGKTGNVIELFKTGAAISELAPLTFLLNLIRPGDTVVIEEPEAHLSPQGQAKIAVTLGQLVRAGVKIIITTHSDWLLKEVSNLIREGLLKEKGIPWKERERKGRPEQWLLPDEVGVWQFYKDEPLKTDYILFTNINGIESDEIDDFAENMYNRSVGLHNRVVEAGEIITGGGEYQ